MTTLICFLVLWKCLCRVMGKKGSFRRKEEITCIYFYTYSVYVCTNVYKHIYIYVACLLSRVQLFATPWTVAHQVPLAMGFPRQEYWSGLPLPSPGDLPEAGIEPTSLVPPALAGRFFTTSATWEAPIYVCARTHTHTHTHIAFCNKKPRLENQKLWGLSGNG